MRLTTISGLFSCAAVALTLAAAAQGSLDVGVTEDAGKTADGGRRFFAAMTDLGLKANRVSITWDPANPDHDPRARPRSPPGCRRRSWPTRASSSPSRR